MPPCAANAPYTEDADRRARLDQMSTVPEAPHRHSATLGLSLISGNRAGNLRASCDAFGWPKEAPLAESIRPSGRHWNP